MPLPRAKAGLLLTTVMFSAAGCSPSLMYKVADPNINKPDPPGSLRFTLQDAAISFPKSTAQTTIQGNGQNTPKNADAAADECAGKKVNAAMFNECFTGVPAPTVVSTALNHDGDYVALPADILPALLFRTSISGVAVSGENYLYQKVTVNSTDNVANTLTSVGTGIATGFSVGGPVGGAVGGVIGVGVALVHESPSGGDDISAVRWTDYVCPSKRKPVDAAEYASLKLSFGLPVLVKASDSGPFLERKLGTSILLEEPQPTASKDYPGCWRPIPNSLALNNPPQLHAVPVAFSTGDTLHQPLLQKGDGWFYRIVVTEDAASSGGVASQTFILGGGTKKLSSNQFPVSFCRENAILEVTWWSELARAADMRKARRFGNINDMQFTLPRFPDPNFSVPVNIPPRGGTITFNSDCGAVPLSGSGSNISSDWNALNTQISTLSKALGTSATATKATATPK